jgi:beta-lactamase regulating signal transducer with metallopeptidase domain
MTMTQAMLGNAAVAAMLALFALVVGRTCRSAALRHGAWVLVLVKLVTPPLFPVSLPVLPASWARPSADPIFALSRFPQGPPSRDDTSGPAPGMLVRAPAWWEGWQATAADWALGLWVAGAVGWFLWQGRRIIRFSRRVARASGAGPEVAAAALGIAKSLGIARPPAVKIATGIGSPMLWAWGRDTVILFPRELLARLSPEARDTLLAHELAHFLRRDHWVRMLELLAIGLYWWHPAVWLARAEIEKAEEECCDAWVVGGLAASPRRYAEALLATVDFAAELQRPCLPPGACPANRGAQLLHRRLVEIVHAKRPTPPRGWAVVRAAALAASLVQPVLQAAPPEATAPPPPASVPADASPQPSPMLSTTPPPKSVEPPAWATAKGPAGAVEALARDHEVVLRRADGTETALGPGKPLALAFAPNNQRLATAGPGPWVRTWDYGGNVLAVARVPAAARSVAYTPDGGRLLVLDAAGGISVLAPDTLALLTAWSVDGPANSIVCAPDNQTVAVAFGSWLEGKTGWVECWSIPLRQKLTSYRASAAAGAARYGPDGRLLVIGGWNGALTWRALPGGDLIAERQLPKSVTAAAAFSPDAGTLPLEPPPEPPPPAPPTVPDLFQRISDLPGG